MKKCKLFTAALLIVALTLIVTGCRRREGAGGSGAAGRLNISYWVHANPAFEDAARRFASSYSRANPNINVEVEAFGDLWTRVYSSLAAGTCGDVVEMYGSPLRFAQGGVLQPVPDSVMSRDEIEAAFYPGSLTNRIYEGRYYALPEELNIESPGLIVNLALLREQGVEIPATWEANDGPATWDELMQLARRLTRVQGGTMMQAGLGVVGGEEISMLLSLIWQYGGEYRDPVNMRVNFMTPEARRAAEFMMNLIAGPNAVHSAIFSGRFNGLVEGTIAMSIGAPWYTAVIDQDVPGFEYAYYNLPPFIPGSDPYFLGEGGWGHWVPNNARDPEESWRFVTFMLNEENQLEWSRLTGGLPANMRLANNPYFTTGEGRNVIGRAMKIAQYGRDPGSYTFDPSTFVWEIGFNTLQAITSGQLTIDEGLATLEREVNEMITRIRTGRLFDDL